MSSKHDCVLFHHFVKLLHSISQIPPHRAIVNHNDTRTPRSLELLNQWLSRLREYYRTSPSGLCKIFFRLFFPEEDVRRRYNIQEPTLANILAKEVFNLPTTSQGAGRALIEWSTYLETRNKSKLGCLGAELEIALGARYSIRQGTSPTLEMVDQLLDELASLSDYSNLRNNCGKTCRDRTAILRDLYHNLDPVEAKFMTQIILKDLRPVLYPLSETHTTRALLHYKSNATHMLTKWEVMRAWHPSMCNIYRARAVLDEAAQQVEVSLSVQQANSNSQNDPFSPILGIPIEVPKSQKGTKLSHALSFFKHEREVWAETKYDGERMQIHIDLSRPLDKQITIFSKSKRNSTQDRTGTHALIRAALGLPARSTDHVQYPTLAQPVGFRTSMKQSAILDAEMVAYSESKGEIDEFWRIRSLVDSTACGVRQSRHLKKHLKRHEPLNEVQSQSTNTAVEELLPEMVGESLQSNASDNADRHLKLVFFDVMFLDGCSLMHHTYQERRSQLEHLINVISGFVSLSYREHIELGRGLLLAIKDLARIFSQHIANYQEGIVLKGASSTYNSFQQPWVKLKRDYIPGYGDTVDLVIIGASWNKARARELRVAPETFTTFLVAALDLSESESNPAPSLPTFQILFTAEYGLDREQLETLNLYVKSCEPVLFRSSGVSRLPYHFRIPEGLIKPVIMFSEPLLGELFGAGFTKEAGMKYYTLRFPRLTKVWRSSERNWNTGSCLDDFQTIARESIGCESSAEWASRTVDAIWGDDLRPGPRDPRKIMTNAQIWHNKLLELEQIPHNALDKNTAIANGILNPPMKRKAPATPVTLGPSRKRRCHKMLHNEPVQVLRPLGSMTNIAKKKCEDTRPQTTLLMLVDVSQPAHENILKKTNANKAKTEMEAMIPMSPGRMHRSKIDIVLGRICHLGYEDAKFEDVVTTFELPTPLASEVICNDDKTLSVHGCNPPPALNTAPLACSVKSCSSSVIFKNITKSPNQSWPQQYINTCIVQFLQDTYVWISKENGNKRPMDRPPALHIVPQNRRVGVIYFLLIICGCQVEIEGKVYYRSVEQFSHVNKCVAFVKTSEKPEVKEALVWIMEALESWRAELNLPGNKELFIFDSHFLSYSSLTSFRGDIESQALWRSSR